MNSRIFKSFRRKGQILLRNHPSAVAFFGMTCLTTYALTQATPIVELSNIDELKQYKNLKTISIIDDQYALIRTENNSILRLTIPNYEYFEKNIKTEIPIGFRKSTDWSAIASSFLSFGFLAALFYMFSRTNYQNLLQVGKSIKVQTDVSTRFHDVIGQNNAKRAVQEFVHILKNNDKYKEIGVKIPKGALLTGPPGTGKTLLAKAIAGESNIPFINVPASEFNAIFVGVGSAKIKNMYETARRVAKEKGGCIIFIDEIDAIGQKRSAFGNLSGGMSEKENTLNQLLAEMDGFETSENVMTFAATNRPQTLDHALLRPGRFDRKLHVELPNIQERKDLFSFYMKKLQWKNEEDIPLLAEKSAKMVPGFSGADISNIVNESGIFSIRRGCNQIEEEDIRNAIDYVTFGDKKETMLNQNEKEIVAYHEAGHAYLSYILEHVENPIKVSIVPHEKGMLGFSQSDVKDEILLRKKNLDQKINVLMAGRIAEDIFCNDVTNGASNDIEKATDLAKKYVKMFGFHGSNHFMKQSQDPNDDKISNFLKDYADKHVFEYLKTKYKETYKIVLQSKSEIESLKKLLLLKETIYYEDIKNLYEVR